MIARDVIGQLPRARAGESTPWPCCARSPASMWPRSNGTSASCAPGRSAAQLCAVVKADASGHGAVPVARAALAGGASAWRWRRWARRPSCERSGSTAPGARPRRHLPRELPVAVAARAEIVAWTERFVADAGPAGRRRRWAGPIPVHVKLDSGMGRLGTRETGEAVAVAELVLARRPGLALVGAMTHLATADDDPDFVAEQLAVFAPFAERLRRQIPGLRVHAANSAATLRAPAQPPRLRALRDRAVRLRSDECRSGAARAGAGARADLLRRGAQADPARAERGLRPPVRRRA